MKAVSAVLAVLVVVAIAAPAPDRLESLDVSNLERRGCGAGCLCSSGQCYCDSCYEGGCYWFYDGVSC